MYESRSFQQKQGGEINLDFTNMSFWKFFLISLSTIVISCGIGGFLGLTGLFVHFFRSCFIPIWVHIFATILGLGYAFWLVSKQHSLPFYPYRLVRRGDMIGYIDISSFSSDIIFVPFRYYDPELDRNRYKEIF